ncbi:hypothetical protein DXG01_007597, partial [Tephrocybe rancida]
MNSTDNSGSNSGPRLGSTLNLCSPRSRVDAPHAFGADGTTPQALHTFQNAVLEIGPNTTEESLSLDDATRTLLIDALKSESEPTADIKREAPHAEFPSSASFLLFTSSDRMQELHGIDSNQPFDQVAINIPTNEPIKPAIAALAPNAIIDNVKHDFCPPTTTASPPLEEPPPRSTSGLLPISVDLANSGIVPKAPLDLEHRDGTIKTATDGSGFDSRPHLLSTPNLCPSTPRIDAPQTCCADDTIPQAPQTSQNLDFDLTASDWPKVLQIDIDTARENAEGAEGTVESGLDNVLMSLVDAEYRSAGTGRVDCALEADNTILHSQPLLDSLYASPYDGLTTQDVPVTAQPLCSPDEASIIISNDALPRATPVDSPVPQDEDPPRRNNDTHALIEQRDLCKPDVVDSFNSPLHSSPRHEPLAFSNNDLITFPLKPSTTKHPSQTTVKILMDEPIEPAIAVLNPDAISDNVELSFCPPTTTTAPPLKEPPPRSSFGPPLVSTDLDDSSIALYEPPGLEHHGGASNFHPLINSPHVTCPDDTILHDVPLSRNLNHDSSAVPVIVSDRSITLKIGIDTATKGAEKAEDMVEIGIEESPTHPATAKYRFVDVDGVDSIFKADKTFLRTQSITNSLSQRDIDIDPPPPYSFDDAPGTLMDPHKEETQTFSNANPCIAAD